MGQKYIVRNFLQKELSFPWIKLSKVEWRFIGQKVWIIFMLLRHAEKFKMYAYFSFKKTIQISFNHTLSLEEKTIQWHFSLHHNHYSFSRPFCMSRRPSWFHTTWRSVDRILAWRFLHLSLSKLQGWSTSFCLSVVL